MTKRYGMKVYIRNGEPMVEGPDGTTIPVWLAIEDRRIGMLRLRTEMIRWLEIQEDYFLRGNQRSCNE